MPIKLFLRGQSFDAAHIEAMEKAFLVTSEALGLSDRTPLVNEIVARKIIKLAQGGMRNATALYFAALQDLIPSDGKLNRGSVN